jgi:hypothetical protein
MPVRKLKPIEERDPCAAMVLDVFDAMAADEIAAELLAAETARLRQLVLPPSMLDDEDQRYFEKSRQVGGVVFMGD